jgi:hypothetical protein
MANEVRANMLNDDDRQYLEMMQGNIERMAANSVNCKAWMVTIVSAMMALQCAVEDLNGWILLGVLPIALFWYLDVYYLHLERGMRNRERVFVNILKSNEFVGYEEALFNFNPLMIKKVDLTKEQEQEGLVATDDRWLTKSVVPFYGMALVAIVIIWAVLNWEMIAGWLA